jgi:hypothetical protein
MPIRPENKLRYPPDWYAISLSIKDRAGHKCEDCGVPNYEKGGRDPQGGWHKARPTGDNGLRLTWPLEGEDAWCEGWPHKLRIIRIVPEGKTKFVRGAAMQSSTRDGIVTHAAGSIGKSPGTGVMLIGMGTVAREAMHRSGLGFSVNVR